MKYTCVFSLAVLAAVAVLTNGAPQGGQQYGPPHGPPGGGAGGGGSGGISGQAGFGWSAGASGQAGAGAGGDSSSSSGTRSLVKRSALDQTPPDQRPPRPSNSLQGDVSETAKFLVKRDLAKQQNDGRNGHVHTAACRGNNGNITSV